MYRKIDQWHQAKLEIGRWEGNIKRNFIKALHESNVLVFWGFFLEFLEFFEILEFF